METPTQQYNIFDLGFDKLLSKGSVDLTLGMDVADTGLVSVLGNAVSDPIDLQKLASGEWIGNVSIKDGYLQSSNFVTGVSGWRIDNTGNVEFNNGVFRGNISAATGTIGGFTITATSLYGGIIKTAAIVDIGGTGVIMDTAGLRGYDSVLGLTFNLPTNGSAPTFSSGIINYTTFNVNTNAVIRTSSTVGDGTVNSAGILMNNTGFYACQASQTLANANVKILIDGSATFAGTLSAVSGTLGSLEILSPGNIRGGQTAFKTGDGVFIGYDSTLELDQWATPSSNSDYEFANGSTTMLGVRFFMSIGTTTIKKISVKLKVDSSTTGILSCDIYQADNNYVPTGASLGTATTAGISNTAYAVIDFTFNPAVTINSNYDYIAVFSCATSNVPIDMANSGFAGDLGGIRFMYYNGLWHKTSLAAYPYIRIYSYNVGYKISIGNASYGLSYNGVNMQTVGSNIVRNVSIGDNYNEITSYGMSCYEGGQRTFTANYSDGILWRILKGFTNGFLKLGQIVAAGTSQNDILDYAGVRISNGKSTNYDILIYAKDNNAMRIDSSANSGYTGGLFVVGGNSQMVIGSSTYKATVYCSGLSACPLPTVDSALSVLSSIPEPKDKDQLKDPDKAHFEYKEKSKKRKYFDIDDMPDELTFINDAGEKDIELIRVVGFLFNTVKELNNKIKIK